MKGKENIIADSLSRIKILKNQNIDEMNLSDSQLNYFECGMCYKKSTNKASLTQHENYNDPYQIPSMQFNIQTENPTHINEDHNIIEPEEDDDHIIYSAEEGNTKLLPISAQPLNFYHKQIIIKNGMHKTKSNKC